MALRLLAAKNAARPTTAAGTPHGERLEGVHAELLRDVAREGSGDAAPRVLATPRARRRPRRGRGRGSAAAAGGDDRCGGAHATSAGARGGAPLGVGGVVGVGGLGGSGVRGGVVPARGRRRADGHRAAARRDARALARDAPESDHRWASRRARGRGGRGGGRAVARADERGRPQHRERRHGDEGGREDAETGVPVRCEARHEPTRYTRRT